MATKGSCPKCGGEGRTVYIQVKDKVNAQGKAQIRWRALAGVRCCSTHPDDHGVFPHRPRE